MIQATNLCTEYVKDLRCLRRVFLQVVPRRFLRTLDRNLIPFRESLEGKQIKVEFFAIPCVYCYLLSLDIDVTYGL